MKRNCTEPEIRSAAPCLLSAGFPTCRVADFQSADHTQVEDAWNYPRHPQVENLRYSRLEACAGIRTFLRKNPVGISPQSPGMRGRTELPWVKGCLASQPQGGCDQFWVQLPSCLGRYHVDSEEHHVAIETQPLWGCAACRKVPRVARSSQPWASGRNPVGIPSRKHGRAFHILLGHNWKMPKLQSRLETGATGWRPTRDFGVRAQAVVLAIGMISIGMVCQAIGAEETNASPTREAGLEAAASVADKASAGSPAAQDFLAFKLIMERNIFNPNRRPGVTGPPPKVEKLPKIDSFSLVGTLLYEDGNFAFFAGTESGYNKVLKTGEMIGDCKITEITQDAVHLQVAENNLLLPMDMKLTRRDEGNWEVGIGAASSSGSSGSQGRSSSSEARRDRTPGSDSRRGGDPGSFNSRRGGDPGSSNSRRGGPGGSGGRRDRTSAPAAGTNEVVEESEPADATPSVKAAESTPDEILKKLMQKREQEMTK